MVTVPSRTRMALCICFQRVSRRYIAGWRGSSENPAFFYRCTKESNVDPAEVAKKGRMLLANPEISLYCPIIRFLVDQNKINNRTCMASVYVRSDVGREACFLPIYYKNYFCSIKYVQ